MYLGWVDIVKDLRVLLEVEPHWSQIIIKLLIKKKLGETINGIWIGNGEKVLRKNPF